MRHRLIIGLVMALSSLTALTARAQSPLGTSWTYQGELTSGGSPASGVYDLRFHLYDAAAGGNQIGNTLCSDNLSIDAGRFMVSLDFGPVFAGLQLYLEIEVRPDSGLDCTDATGYTTLSPRQAMNPTPNAVWAQSALNADFLAGRPASVYLDASHLEGVLLSQSLEGAYSESLAFDNPTNIFVGNGAGLNLLNATNITSGVLEAARMPTNWAAGGDLNGFFPSPTIAPGAVTLNKLAPDVQGVLSNLGNVPLEISPLDAVAWGRGDQGQTLVFPPPFSITYTAVAGGGEFSLALRNDGNLAAWGRNDNGQLNVPVLPGGVTYTAVAAGAEHGLALRSDGTIAAWGRNDAGQTDVPALPGGMTYTAIAGGATHSLALRSDGNVIVWGDNGGGLTLVPPLPGGVVYTGVAGGGAHCLALRSDGMVAAWGWNAFGQTDVPPLPGGMTYTGVSSFGDFSLALRSDGNIVAWGRDTSGQTIVPALPPGATYTKVVAGGFHSLALRSDGTLIAWGENGDGQTSVPALLPGMVYSAIGAGYFHSLAVRGTQEGPFLDTSIGLRIGVAAPPPSVGGLSIAGDSAFAGNSTFAGSLTALTFTGNGSGLTNLNAANLTGTLSDNRLSGNIPRLNTSNTFGGGLTASSFTGSGAGLSNLNATNLTAGTVRQTVLPVSAWANIVLPVNAINSSSFTNVNGTAQTIAMRQGVAVISWTTSGYINPTGVGFAFRVRAFTNGVETVGPASIFYFNQGLVHTTISGNAVVTIPSNGNTTFSLQVRGPGNVSFQTDTNDSFTATIINIGQ